MTTYVTITSLVVVLKKIREYKKKICIRTPKRFGDTYTYQKKILYKKSTFQINYIYIYYKNTCCDITD